MGDSLIAQFGLNAIPEILFGNGRLSEIGERVTTLTGPSAGVLLVADPALAKLGITARAYQYLQAGHEPRIFDSFMGEPKSSTIDQATIMAIEARAKVIVGLGGGTALDTAKLVAACAASGAPAETYELCKSPLPLEPLPVIAVPTTAGTGSEVTSTSVFANSRSVKVWAWGPPLKPQLALLDPELTLGVPPPVTAATGLDALVHAIEACTNRNRNDITDLYCHRAITLISANLKKAVEQGGDLAARGAVLLGSCLAGIAIDNCGTALAHNMSHALAALAPIAHGRATGLAMLATMDWVAEAASEQFAHVAVAMGEPQEPRAAVAAFDRLVRSLRMKISLEGEGLDLDRPERLAEQMAAPENAPMRKSTRRAITDDDLLPLARRLFALREATM
jgi:alcohol dehydrogenase class IV